VNQMKRLSGERKQVLRFAQDDKGWGFVTNDERPTTNDRVRGSVANDQRPTTND
jgi:hypothetical protein